MARLTGWAPLAPGEMTCAECGLRFYFNHRTCCPFCEEPLPQRPQLEKVEK
jgi:predicted amidophosphoribosyltransferase